MCDFESCWTGASAQWLESCEDPSDTYAPSITWLNKQIAPAVTAQDLLGGVVPDGPGCFQFAEWSQWTPYAINVAANMAGLPPRVKHEASWL